MSAAGFSEMFPTASNDGENVTWATDLECELAARVSDAEVAAGWVPPMTVTGLFQRTAKLRGKHTAFRVMREKEYKWTWNEYLEKSRAFAKGLHRLGIEERKSVNIMGSNAPEWALAFMGALMHNNIPCGMAATNTKE